MNTVLAREEHELLGSEEECSWISQGHPTGLGGELLESPSGAQEAFHILLPWSNELLPHGVVSGEGLVSTHPLHTTRMS